MQSFVRIVAVGSRAMLVGLLGVAGGCSQCGKTSARAHGDVAEISVGSGEACARMKDGKVLCWGSNRLHGMGVQSPSPTHQFFETPIELPGIRAERIVLVGVKTCLVPPGGRFGCIAEAGYTKEPPKLVTEETMPNGRLVSNASTACAIGDDGAAFCWGENDSGRLTPGATRASNSEGRTYAKLDLGAPVTTVAMGGRHGCALLRDKHVTCWGLNNFGQLGADRLQTQQRPKPTVVDGIDDVTELASGYFHTCALKSDGTVWCWGRGDHGELGIGESALQGTGDHRHAPAPTEVKDLSNVIHVFAQSSETCAITKKQALYCWGQNDKGQVGDGTSESRFVPAAVVDIEAVSQVSIGDRTVCALTENADAYCWGDNNDGYLGNGGVESSARPTLVKLGAAGTSAAPALEKDPGPLATFESLACGFRFKAPAHRIYSARDDLTLESFAFQDSKIEARCTLAKSQKLATIEDAEKTLHGTRRRIGTADCLERDSVIDCYTAQHFVAVRAPSTNAKLTRTVLDSVEFFDLKSVSSAAAASVTGDTLSIPAGEFGMGCANESLFAKPVGAVGCSEDAQPLHRVRLSAFSIDRAVVTYGDYSACVGASRCKPAAYGKYDQPKSTEPAGHVTWEQAGDYCSWKGESLPTEAQWERATASPDFAIGLHEWTNDAFAKTYYLESPVADPKGPASSIHHTIRGIGRNGARSDAITYRHGKEPAYQDTDLQFRCAR